MTDEMSCAMDSFERKVAVVTGAASGIGFALAERFAREGMNVVLADIRREPLEQSVAMLRAHGLEAIGVPTDVGSMESVENLARAATDAYGRVHLLCNNAGVTKHTGEAVWELTDNDWHWLFAVNVWGIVNGIRAFVPRMISQNEGGYIVNTASIAGLVVGGGAYGVVKHAAVSLSESLYVDLRKRKARIGVTCLCPGLVATNIVASEESRPELLANTRAETTEQSAYRARVAAFTSSQGLPPSKIADAVVDAIRVGRFYAITDDPPTVVSADTRIKARMESILRREHPVEFALRKPATEQ